MPKFITLHDFAVGCNVYVNPEHIVCVKNICNTTQVMLVFSYVEVKESPEEVLSIIKDANIELNGL